MDIDHPTLAICIPTFNRSRYLENLLRTFHDESRNFPHSFEFIISDNASEDNTSAMIEPWQEKLPIRYFRQETNIGPHPNLEFAFEQSQSPFMMYVADDDLIDVDGLGAALDKLLSEPEVVALYAPWTLVDLVNNKTLTKFYDIPTETKVKHGNFLHLLSLILQHHIFAEIVIVKTAAFRRLLPRSNDIAHWAFTVPTEYLSLGDVMFCPTPFYKSITNYFPGKQREQLGGEEVEVSWDAYRGGLEHLLGLCIANLNEKTLQILKDGIQNFVTLRMSVALRIRIAKGRDPIESYFLASRMRGAGAVQHLPKPFNSIRSEAVLWFVTHDASLIGGVRKIALVGGFEQSVRDHLAAITDLDVIILDVVPRDLENTLLVMKGKPGDHEIDVSQLEARSNRTVFEDDLLKKFL